MGTIGKKIVEEAGIKIPELISMLNKALADEWLAYYQYWIGAQVAVGMPRGAVVQELLEHANDELKHAGMLVERIIQLGGTPLLEPKEWYSASNCGYDKPSDPDVKVLLDQNIKGEQCAINVYKKLMEYVGQKDPVTFHLAFEILEDEVEHEEDLEAIREDIRMSMKK